MESDWGKLLQNTKAKDLLANQKLFTINANQSIKDLLSILKEKGITGLPVLEGGKAIGLVDVLDVAAYALFLWRNYSQAGKFMELLEQNKFFETEVRKLINFSSRNPFVYLTENATLLDCVKQFRSYNWKNKRLLILNNNGEPLNIFTMWDMLNFAKNNLKSIKMENELLKRLQYSRPCIVTKHDEYTLDALSNLVDNSISGLAIVDYEFKLLCNFSASDLKGMLKDAFDMFDKPVIDFIRQGTDTKSKLPPITLNTGHTLGDVINTMTKEKVHRVFLDDRLGHFFGIISSSDVIQAISPKLKPEMVTSQ